MIEEILKAVMKNIQTFIVIWVVLLILNQLFIFGGCFKSYCLLAALPHTGIISAVLTYFFIVEEKKSSQENDITTINNTPERKDNEYELIDENLDENDFDEVTEPFCPKCGSKMVLRTAKRGKYAGQKFWGCSKYPKCNGILKI